MVSLTYGIEEEFFVVNSALSSVCVPPSVFDKNPDFDVEMHKSVLETKTKVHSCINSLIDEVSFLRDRAQQALAPYALSLLGTGTHPYQKTPSDFASEGPYFEELKYKYQHLVEDNYICGMHMHVGASADEDTVLLYNNLIEILPLLLALSANSPYWAGVDTGLMSYRSRVWKRLPRTTTPEPIESVGQYLDEHAKLFKFGLNLKPTSIWSDMRIHPTYKTIEIRIMDAQSNVENVRALAAFIAAYCKYVLSIRQTPQPYKRAVLEENIFLASRFGTNAYFYQPDFSQVHCIVMLSDYLEKLKPFFDNPDDILYVMNLLIKGSPAIEQRKLLTAGLSAFKHSIIE